MSEKMPLLSLCIPTYNRSYYLELNLKQLYSNWLDISNKNDIEILIYDNASTDHTWDIVYKYHELGLPIEYVKNPENIGSDGNFALCITRAIGKYVWIFGDDELLFNHTLKRILEILKNYDIGCIHIKGIGYDLNYNLDVFNSIPEEQVQLITTDEFIRKVNFYITFCTGNILNKSILPENFDYQKFRGTNLIQVHWYLSVLKQCINHIILNEKYFFSKKNNSGGYQLIKTFSSHFNGILREHVSPSVRKEINHALLNNFFLFHIKNATTFDKEPVFRELFKNYFAYPSFWSKIVPAMSAKWLKKNILHVLLIKEIIYRLYTLLYKIKIEIDNLKFKNSLGFVGENFQIGKDVRYLNPQFISIGSDFSALDRFSIEAITMFLNENFKPNITIGNNVFFHTDIHIRCIDRIVIGDNCLFESRVYITDHDHGDVTAQDIRIPPNQRRLKSKGPIIIENNVYVGEGVLILSGVCIGENSIIRPNSVVTENVPRNAIYSGTQYLSY